MWYLYEPNELQCDQITRAAQSVNNGAGSRMGGNENIDKKERNREIAHLYSGKTTFKKILIRFT